MEATAFAPGHVTCFFSVHASDSVPPAQRGSRGAGFSTQSGVRTRVTTQGQGSRAPGGPGLPFELEVRDRGAAVADPRTTRGALIELARRAPEGARFAPRLVVENDYSLPLGAGFGMSGACALGATIAANDALGLGLPFGDCVAAAHVGEVEARSGLGDVVAQAAGGFEARLREGAPPHGRLQTFPSEDVPLLLVSFGPIHTSDFLAHRERLAAVNAEGEACLERLLAAPSLPSAVRLGREFAGALALISKPAQELLSTHAVEAEGTVAMLGDSLVFLDPAPGLLQAAREAGAPFTELTRLSRRGARLLKGRLGQLD